MKRETLAIADIYVPVKRRATLDQKRVHEIATSMLDKGQQAPILVRTDGARFVLALSYRAPPRKPNVAHAAACRDEQAIRGRNANDIYRFSV